MLLSFASPGPFVTAQRRQVALLAFGFTFILLAASACSKSEPPELPAAASETASPLVRLLAEGHAVFGTFTNPSDAAQAAEMGQTRTLDFIFSSLERGPFELAPMVEYMAEVERAAAPEPTHPMALRVPAIRDGAAQALTNVADALAAGVTAVVFPHVESAEQAVVAVEAMGSSGWPGNPDGTLVNMLIVEDREGVERADEITATAGVSVVFAGPGDLRRAYEGDMVAVEEAIQTVLTACRAHEVPCGITAGPNDIGERIAQGFRVFIVSDLTAVAVGRDAAGR